MTSKKIGSVEIRITLEIAERLRKRVLEIKGQNDGEKRPFKKIAAIIHPEFPEFVLTTIEDYSRVTGNVSDKVFDLYRNGHISFTELTEFGQTTLSEGDIEFIALEYVAQEMNLPMIRKIKNLLRTYKDKMSVREAIDRATGKISSFAKPEAVKKINRDFDSLLDEAVKYMTLSRSKVSQLIDLLPVSTLDKGKVHSELFNKVYLLRHILGEQLEFVDKKVKTYLDELVRFVATESQLNELRRKMEERDGSDHRSDRDPRQGDEGEQAEAVHDAGQVLPDPAGEHSGEGRNEA